MHGIKSYGLFLLSLLVALIALNFTLKVLKKTPVIGGIAGKAQELAH